MKSMDKFIGPKKPEPAPLKPVEVNIIQFQGIPLATNNGITQGITVLTLGLGSDGMIYQYDKKEWREMS